jgi:hypothetical protein
MSLRLFLPAIVAAVLATVAGAGIAAAQTPTSPRASSTCTGTLVLTPSVVTASVFPGAEVTIAASGLEPDAAYTIFIGGMPFASATTNNAGTTSGSIFVRLVAPAIDVQVTTAGRCAAATLRVAVPLIVSCGPFGVVTPFGCTVVISPTVLIPVANVPGFCTLPGRPILVPC